MPVHLRSVIMARKVYSQEFRDAAVQQVVEQRHSVASVSQRLGINSSTLTKWVDAAKQRADRSLIPADMPVDQRLRALEKENARLRMERDILKKAAAYFAKLEAEGSI
jgi:transposase